MNDPTPLDPRLIKEAAAWLVRLHSRPLRAAEQAQLDAWRARSPDHERAWERALRLQAQFRAVPGGLPVRVESQHGRRRALRGLAGLALVGGSWGLYRLPWSTWQADQRTAIGERRSIDIARRARLDLNTATAVDVDPASGSIWLRAGELLLTRAIGAGSDAAAPVTVRTDAGRVEIADGRCDVRLLDNGRTRVAVLRGTTRVVPDGAAERAVALAGGHSCEFSHDAVQASTPVTPNDEVWVDGLIYAAEMPLGEFVERLQRYHRAVLRCDPAAAEIAVSGVYQTADLDRILGLLARSYPVKVRGFGHLWVTLERVA